jgi:hypothetical protein
MSVRVRPPAPLTTFRGKVFPKHRLICDLMTRKFFQTYGGSIREKLEGLGATIKLSTDDPEALFLNSGYERVNEISIVEKSMEFQSQKVPKFLLRTLLRTLVNGYVIYVFEARTGSK